MAISLAVEKGSRKKYGPRRNERPWALQRMFDTLRPALHPEVAFASDQDPLYVEVVQRNFPGATHRRTRGGRGCVTGQGELKQLRFDPLYSINHTCAMLKANINRLFRRTWCTTKKVACLRQHLAVYVEFHNTRLVEA